MPVIKYLERNADLYGNEVALVELNPEENDRRRVTWKEYELIESDRFTPYRREITWKVFDEKANRFANMLLSRGIKKGDKVAIIMYNCLEWLPIYFGILKTGAIAVPFNFRYDADEILYCADLAEVDVIVFDPAFIGRIEQNADVLSRNRLLIYVLADQRLGEITAAIIEVKEQMTLTEEEVNEFCLGLARYKRPKKIIFTSIPRNATGKIEKPKLREMYGVSNLVEKETNN